MRKPKIRPGRPRPALGEGSGHKRTREYRSWASAKDRCFSPNNEKYPIYGGRGITMCAEWRNDYQAFLRDMGRCPPGLTLDRKDTNGNYEPGNCRWATRKQQANNVRHNVRLTYLGRDLTMQQFADEIGRSADIVAYHLKKGREPQQIAARLARR